MTEIGFEEIFKWPSGSERLFDTEENADNPADLRWLKVWCDDEDAAYSDSYYALAELGLRVAAVDHRQRDKLIFAIIYSCRHYVELEMKQFVRRGMRVLDNTPHYEIAKFIRKSSHDLTALWSRYRKYSVRLNPEHPTETLEYIEALIQEFMRKDPYGDAFRYADGGGEAGTMMRLGVTSFQDAMLRIRNFFEGSHSALMAYEDNLREMRQMEADLLREIEAEWQ